MKSISTMSPATQRTPGTDIESYPFSEFARTSLETNIETLPGWTTLTERKFNHWYASTIYSGIGEIVDLGCMIGSSTSALASGLVKNRRVAGKRIHAFDLFRKTWNLIGNEPLADVPKEGHFLALFLANTSPWKNNVIVYEGDICKIGWIKQPIQYLLVDIMKDWDPTKRVACDFFPFLLPDSLLVHQDFNHLYTGWIHPLMFRLRNHLVPVFEIPESDSVVFQAKGEISHQACEYAASFDLSPEEIYEAFDYSASLIRKNSKTTLLCARALFFYEYAYYVSAQGADNRLRDRCLELCAKEYFTLRPQLSNDHDFQLLGTALKEFLTCNVKLPKPYIFYYTMKGSFRSESGLFKREMRKLKRLLGLRYGHESDCRK